MTIAPAKDAQSYKVVYHPAQHDEETDSSRLRNRITPLEERAVRLNHSTGSLISMMRVHGASDGPFHALEFVNAHDDTCHILFFQIHTLSVRVANLFLELDDSVVNLFADFVFKTWPGIGWVEFENCNRIETISARYAFQNNGAVNFIRFLPDHFDVFMKSLGKDTVRNYRRYMEKAQRDIGLRISVVEKDALDRKLFDEVIELKNRQLRRLGIFVFPDDYLDALFLTHQQFGLTILIYSEERLVAFYMVTIAHRGCECWVTAYDPEFSKYWLGNLSVLEAVRAAIGKGCHRANFMWGRSDQKEILGAKPETLRNLVVARHLAGYGVAVISVGIIRPVKAFLIRGMRFVIRRFLVRVRKYRAV